MERDFYKNILTDDFGVGVLVPKEVDREIVHTIIYEELVQGKINAGSRLQYIRIIEEAIKNGAEGVVLGCTEIPLLIGPSDVSIPTFNTTQIHAEKAVEFALSSGLVN
jgi:aspartate racemase